MIFSAGKVGYDHGPARSAYYACSLVFSFGRLTDRFLFLTPKNRPVIRVALGVWPKQGVSVALSFLLRINGSVATVCCRRELGKFDLVSVLSFPFTGQ
jgi:hypothetical protein